MAGLARRTLPDRARLGLACLALLLAAPLPLLAAEDIAAADLPLAVAPQAPSETPLLTQLDAELRFRFTHTRNLGDLQAGQDEFRRGLFQRSRVGTAFERGDLSAYLQLQASGALGQAGPGEQPLAIGLQQGTARVRSPFGLRGVTFDAGRMVLDFGAGRQIGRYDFHNSGNAFDGVQLRYELERYLQINALAVKIRRNSAQPEEERNLFGLYMGALPTDGLRSEIYFLYLRDGSLNDSARILTMGVRIDWSALNWMGAEAEAAVQVGEVQAGEASAPLNHVASMGAANLRGMARIGVPATLTLGAQVYSGDTNANDKTSSAWRPLYPSLDEVIGQLQMFRQTNLLQYGARLKVLALPTLAAEIDARVHASHPDANLPGLGNAKLNTAGNWAVVGREIDGRLRWQWHPSTELLGGVGLFDPSALVRTQLGAHLGWQAFLQWTTRF